jgi:hypothetical protein
MIDRSEILREVLTAASPLATAIGNRVWSPIAPDTWDGSQKAIIFHQSTSGSHITGATNTASFVFKCYGGDKYYGSSRELFRLLYDRLQMNRETVASGSIITARLETDTQLPPDPSVTNDSASWLATFSITFEG